MREARHDRQHGDNASCRPSHHVTLSLYGHTRVCQRRTSSVCACQEHYITEGWHTEGWHTAQVLQGAVDVALQALRQIEAFEQQVQEQEMATVRGERSTSSGGVMSAAQASAKLRRLIDQVRA